MRVRLLSDLHVDFAPYTLEWRGEDILVLAGDVCPGIRRAVAMIDAYMLSAPDTVHLVCVCGNHDSYGTSVSASLKEWRALDRPRVHFLENDSVVLGGVRFWGCTMWTDLARLDPSTVQVCRRALSDFSEIVGFTPAEFAARHRESRGELEHVLNTTTEPVVVVTHHLPSARSQDPKYAGDPLGPSFYAQDVDHLLEHPAILAWMHGHTHSSVDYHARADGGGARVLCNPRGYVKMFREHVKSAENPAFQDALIIDLDADSRSDVVGGAA